MQIQRELSGWGLELARDLVRCEGRSIGETIKIVSGKDAFAIRNGDWTRDMDRTYHHPFNITIYNSSSIFNEEKRIRLIQLI